MDYIIFGYGRLGIEAARVLHENDNYIFYGFVDNNIYLQGNYSYDRKIMSFDEMRQLYISMEDRLKIIIAVEAYPEIVRQCEENGICIDSIWRDGRRQKWPLRKATFQGLDLKKGIRLYAGDITDSVHLNDENLYGLSINREDDRHIAWDITKPYPIPDNSIAAYEAENVFEFIEKSKQLDAINEIYRILKPGGVFRLSLPDYNSPYMLRRCMRTESGRIIYDPGEDACIKWGKEGMYGGYIDFTTYEEIDELLAKSNFVKIQWLRYYDSKGNQCRRKVDQEKGYCHRISNEPGVRDFNLLVDCEK